MSRKFHSLSGRPVATALALVCLFWPVYALSFGDPALLNGDTLFPERLYRDLVLEGGSLALWLFPLPAYWTDIGVYFAIRSMTGETTAAMAGYAAIQLCLLALALLFCVWPAMTDTRQKYAAPFFCALAVFLLSRCEGWIFAFSRMPAMHGMTLTWMLFCVGFMIRLVQTPARRGLALAFTVLLAVAYASDAILMLWFVIPAAAFLCWLFWRKTLARRDCVFLLCCLMAACVAGKAGDILFHPPTTDFSPVHLSITRTLRAVPEMVRNATGVLGQSPLAMGLFALTAGVAALRRDTMPRHLTLLLAVMFLCTIAGVLVNGQSRPSYILPVLLITPLVGVAMLPAIFPARLARPLGIGALVVLCCNGITSIRKDFSPFYPPLARCIDAIAERRPIRTGVGTFWEANFAPLFTKNDVRFSVSHLVTLTSHPFLATSRHVSDRYDLVLLDERSDSFRDMETMLLHLNGQPAETFTCRDTGTRAYVYPEKGARLATDRDYINDDGLLQATRKDRDVLVWKGDAEIGPGLRVHGAALRYRKNRIWILLSLPAAPESLRGRQFTIYAAGDKAKPAARLAKKYLSETGNGTLDALWRRLAWRHTVTVGPDNSEAGPEGGTTVYVEGPSRDIRDLPLLMLESEGTRTRIR